MEKIFYSHTNEEMWKVAKFALKELRGRNLILLRGDLGAGKTTFAQGILNTLGAQGPFTSPTFVIMKKYDLKKSDFRNVYHLDCYRVGSIDVQELGWDEILRDKNNLVLVEWPERIWDIVPEEHILIDFQIIDKNKRKMLLNI